MSLFIRYATKADAPLIADISHQTFYETFASENTAEDMRKFLSEQFTKGKLMLEVGTPENTFLLAYQDNQPAGYVKLRNAKCPASLGSRNALEIARIYVISNLKGKGIGNYLMEASLQEAREMYKEVVWLGVWEKNKRAIHFYIKWGFEKFDETDFLLGNDLQRDWLMKRKI
ncbi:MAG: GNAT family N-acetyltransferase [Flavisolibacter sp.]